jgi:hypothetical protein
MEFITSILEVFPVWLQAIMGVVTAATAITALTPSTADDRAINFALKILNFLAGNVMKNRNKDA